MSPRLQTSDPCWKKSGPCLCSSRSANDKSQLLLLPAALSIIKGKDRYGWNEEEADGGGWGRRAGGKEPEKRKMNPGEPVLRLLELMRLTALWSGLVLHLFPCVMRDVTLLWQPPICYQGSRSRRTQTMPVMERI